ncbi:unnamed protein product, partial [Coregonus sp. 'balchen']
MAKSFSHRRQDVMQSPPVSAKSFSHRRQDVMQSPPSTFMGKLDQHTPRLLSLFKSKGGAVKEELQGLLEAPATPQEERRGWVIRGLMIYLGERVEDLIKEYKTTNMIQEDLAQHVLKVFV